MTTPSIQAQRITASGDCHIHNISLDNVDRLQQQFAFIDRNEGEVGFHWKLPDWLTLLGGEIK